MLKRIRTTPLPASAYLSGVLGSTAATTLAITACIMAIGAFAFGAVPRASGYTPAARAPATDLLVLLAWTAGACAFATWRFRWH